MTADQHYFVVSQRLMPPHFTTVDFQFVNALQIVPHISRAGSCVPLLHRIGHNNGSV